MYIWQFLWSGESHSQLSLFGVVWFECVNVSFMFSFFTFAWNQIYFFISLVISCWFKLLTRPNVSFQLPIQLLNSPLAYLMLKNSWNISLVYQTQRICFCLILTYNIWSNFFRIARLAIISFSLILCVFRFHVQISWINVYFFLFLMIYCRTILRSDWWWWFCSLLLLGQNKK